MYVFSGKKIFPESQEVGGDIAINLLTVSFMEIFEFYIETLDENKRLVANVIESTKVKMQSGETLNILGRKLFDNWVGLFGNDDE